MTSTASSPTLILYIRALITIPLSLFMLRYGSGLRSYQIQEKEATKMLLTRSLISAVNTCLLYTGILLVEAHTATILSTLAPIAALVLEVALLGQPVTLLKIGIFVLSIMGAVLVVDPSIILPWIPEHLDRRANNPLGIAICVLASVITAANGIILKKGGLNSR